VESITWKDNGTALVTLHRRKMDDVQKCLLGRWLYNEPR
jgi:hypothetical protein